MNLYKLALRHLLARPRQTLLIYLGVTFGAVAFVAISGFFVGFQGFLINQLVNNDAHIKITNREEVLTDHGFDSYFFEPLNPPKIFWDVSPSGRKANAKITDYQGWYEILNSDPRVEAYSSHFTTPANLVQRGQAAPISLVGIHPAKLIRVTTLADYVTEGQLGTLAKGGNNLMAGDGVLNKIGAKVGQTVFIDTPGRKQVPFKISGRFHTGLQLLDDTRVYGFLPEVQSVTGRSGQINEIAIRLKDYETAGQVASNWTNYSLDKILSWDQINANFLSVFNIQNGLRKFVITVITIVGGFGIYNVLTMMVNQKRKDIAILRSMGFRAHQVLKLFLVQGFLVGAMGGVSGVIFGFLLSLYLETIPFTGPIGGPGHLTISFNPFIYFSAIFLSIFSSTLAGYLPARAAGKLTPIEIIRSGTD